MPTPDCRVTAETETLPANLQAIVCNSRFRIPPSVQVKHFAPHVLGQLVRCIGADWRQRYGITPWLMETCVEATRSGTAYRAANWIEVGMTAGRGRQDREAERRAAPQAGVPLSAGATYTDAAVPQPCAVPPGLGAS